MSQRSKNKEKKKAKGDNSKLDHEEMLEDILSSVEENKYKTLAKELAAVLLPAISTVISETIKKQSVSKEELEKCKASSRVNKYDNDRLEQYTRRENIRIFNLKVEEGVQLADAVVNLLNDIMQKENAVSPPYVFSDKDIEVCHRVGKPRANGGVDNRSIIVRFESRKSVAVVFKYKKNLKHLEKYKSNGKSVYITEDLTQLRVKLRDFLKGQDDVENVYTRDGNIHCMKAGKHYVITNPDDLFELGIEPDLGALQLDSYL